MEQVLCTDRVCARGESVSVLGSRVSHVRKGMGGRAHTHTAQAPAWLAGKQTARQNRDFRLRPVYLESGLMSS